MPVKLKALLYLSRPKVVAWVLTVWFTYYTMSAFNTNQSIYDVLLNLIFCVPILILGCMIALILNNYLEVNIDRLMLRTSNRPLVKGILKLGEVRTYIMLLVFLNVTLFILYAVYNVYNSIITLLFYMLTLTVYTIEYTPLKKKHWISSLAGALTVSSYVLHALVLAGVPWELVLVIALCSFLWGLAHLWLIYHHWVNDYRRAKIKLSPVASKPIFLLPLTLMLIIMLIYDYNYFLVSIIYIVALVILGLKYLSAKNTLFYKAFLILLNTMLIIIPLGGLFPAIIK